ncbi:MAG TPA: hypothetical protein VJO99_25605 [Burkholderiaceae bacterium]|nr:hypothetical protein [Burkholderiaceae bacterium]
MTTLAAPAAAQLPATRTAVAPAVPRFDMYAAIHKALRSLMSDTLLQVGRMDVNDLVELDATLNRVDMLLDLCFDHIEHENGWVHTAIEARRPAGAARTAHDHEEHFESIATLRAEVAALRAARPQMQAMLAHRLYQHLALFVAENFQHMHIEETANNAALWALYSDAELHAIHGRLLAAIPPAKELQIVRWMVPACSPMERAAIVGHAKTQMPPEAFLGALAHVRPHLDASGWLKLAAAVGVAPSLGLAV